MAAKYAHYTYEDEEVLKRLYPIYGQYWPEWEQVFPGHSLDSIKTKAQKMELRVDPKRVAEHKRWASYRMHMKAKPWNDHMKKTLLNCLLELGKELGCPPEVIVLQAQELMELYHARQEGRR